MGRHRKDIKTSHSIEFLKTTGKCLWELSNWNFLLLTYLTLSAIGVTAISTPKSKDNKKIKIVFSQWLWSIWKGQAQNAPPLRLKMHLSGMAGRSNLFHLDYLKVQISIHLDKTMHGILKWTFYFVLASHRNNNIVHTCVKMLLLIEMYYARLKAFINIMNTKDRFCFTCLLKWP